MSDFGQSFSNTASQRKSRLRPRRGRPHAGSQLAAPPTSVRVLSEVLGKLGFPTGHRKTCDRSEVCSAIIRIIRFRRPPGKGFSQDGPSPHIWKVPWAKGLHSQTNKQHIP